MRKIKDDCNYDIVILGLKKVLAQRDIDNVFEYYSELVNYQRFCYNEDDFRESFSLTNKEKVLLGRILFENDLNKLEKLFFERYPLLV